MINILDIGNFRKFLDEAKVVRKALSKNIMVLKYAKVITVYLNLQVEHLKLSYPFFMRYYPFYIFVFLIVNFGCNNAPSQKPEETADVSDNLKNITSIDIESFRFDDYDLSDDSKKALENWQKYRELNDQIDYIKKADFSFFNGEKKVLKAFINDFKAELPEAVKTAPILSRITALETKLLKLNSILKLENVDKANRLSVIKEFLIAISNLNLQINKKFELDANLVDKNDNNE